MLTAIASHVRLCVSVPKNLVALVTPIGTASAAAMSRSLQLRGDHDGAVSVSISPSEAVGAADGSDSKHLQRWLFASGMATLVMDAGTAFYRPPHGVLFQHHRSAYYATLAGIFSAGLAQVGTAYWLSSSGQQGRRSLSPAFRAGVFSASVVPLVAILALGGFASVMKE